MKGILFRNRVASNAVAALLALSSSAARGAEPSGGEQFMNAIGGTLLVVIFFACLAVVLVWIVFPFLVCAGMNRMNATLGRMEKTLETHAKFSQMTEVNTAVTAQNTQKLADFFEGRNVEMNRESPEG